MGKQPTWTAPSGSAPVHACVTVPGSKSLTNRTLILSALAAAQGTGPSTISGALRSRDTDLMIGAVAHVGPRISTATHDDLTVGGRISPAAGTRVDCGLAGTVLRFVPPLAALAEPVVEFDGDEQARARPIAPLLAALRVTRSRHRRRRHAVLGDRHGSVQGGHRRDRRIVVVAVRLGSAAVRSGVRRRADVEHIGPSVPSAPHIAMTVAMLRQAGVDVDDTDDRTAGGCAPGRSRRGTGRSSPTCPTPCRSWPRRWSAAARSVSRAGQRPACSPSQTVLHILVADERDCRPG